MSALTPYDRGERMEPKVWARLAGGVWWAGSTEERSLRHAEDDDFGCVDFDDDEGTSAVTVWVERVDGEVVVHVQPLQDVEPTRVEVHDA